MYFGQVNRNQPLDHLCVLVQPGQPRRVKVFNATVLHQTDKEPKRSDFRTVEQQRPNDKVHPLNVFHFSVVVAECSQNAGEFLGARFLSKEWV